MDHSGPAKGFPVFGNQQGFPNPPGPTFPAEWKNQVTVIFSRPGKG
jgi:hypothetical protein